ncbi:uncharacterized protein METZ01_LOCUS101865, partial [marine metagenome]
WISCIGPGYPRNKPQVTAPSTSTGAKRSLRRY